MVNVNDLFQKTNDYVHFLSFNCVVLKTYLAIVVNLLCNLEKKAQSCAHCASVRFGKCLAVTFLASNFCCFWHSLRNLDNYTFRQSQLNYFIYFIAVYTGH